MVYSPSSNHPKLFPHGGKSPHVVTDEIDAAAVRLQAPKIRPVSSRQSQAQKRRGTADGARPNLRVTMHDMMAIRLPDAGAEVSELKTSDLGVPQHGIADIGIASSRLTSASLGLFPSIVQMVQKPAADRATPITDDVVAELLAEIDAFVENEERQSGWSSQQTQGAITTWETPYNQPAFSTPENIQYTRLAAQYLQQGRIEDAERLYKQALIVAERTFPSGDPAIYRAVEDLAQFYYGHEKFRLSEPLVARLLTYRVERLSPDDWLLIRTVDQLADVYEKCGEAVHAQALYKLLLARQEEAFGRNSPVCAFTLSRLADSYIRHGHPAAAETLMLTILEIQEQLHGPSSLEISGTLNELASIYHRLRRYDRSAEMLERLLKVLESIHGENGLSVASCLLRLADLLTEVDMPAEAEPLYRRAQEIYTLSYGDRTAAHSVFKKKITGTMSKLSKDKPVEQEECWRFPAIKLTFDDLKPTNDAGAVSRCLDQGVLDNSANRPLDIHRTAVKTSVELPAMKPANSYEVDSQLDTQEFNFPSQTLKLQTVSPDSIAPLASWKDSSIGVNVEDFVPDPNSNLNSILDPLFVGELNERYNETRELTLPIDPTKTVEFPLDISGSFEIPLELSGSYALQDHSDVHTGAYQIDRQKVTLAMRVPGLVTVTQNANGVASRPSGSNTQQSIESLAKQSIERGDNVILTNKNLLSFAPDLKRETKNLVQHQEQIHLHQRENFSPPQSGHVVAPLQQRETVREKPVLLPEPFPSSRKKSSKTQSMFSVSTPGGARV
ncbi:tetratricopeptide repeat protein [Candidatus Obscuribacterales bacterium]|nr:tetratricopeptide repeat protein [Candidatus Obscuribacterales bacterium]MBX3149014.1 tetratricopeptide repeat protein [Candidatus Obscuribacterales bacterium]